MHSVLPDIEIIDINEVKTNENNPRFIRDDKFLKLIESIENFPQMLYIRPIVIDAHNMIIGGNQRYLACKELDYKEIPIIRAINLTKEQIKQFIIRDNINNGVWDIDKLIDEWDIDILEACSFDMSLIQKLELSDDKIDEISASNREIDPDTIEDFMILKIKLTEDNYNKAIDCLRKISNDINVAFMELINGKSPI